MKDRTQFIDLMPFEDFEPFSVEETEALAQHEQELRDIWNDASMFAQEKSNTKVQP
jgi:hypothetical protein